MAFDEKRAWVMQVVSTTSWLVCAAVVLSRQAGSLTEVAYAAPLLYGRGSRRVHRRSSRR